MNKKKQQSFYVFIGFLALILVNYPVVYHMQQVRTGKIPFILGYLLVIALLVSLAGFILEKRNK